MLRTDAPRAPGPGSLTWRYAGDPRILGAAGYALLLQLAHPTVAAGVRDTGVLLSLETRGKDHAQEIVAALSEAGYDSHVED